MTVTVLCFPFSGRLLPFPRLCPCWCVCFRVVLSNCCCALCFGAFSSLCVFVFVPFLLSLSASCVLSCFFECCVAHGAVSFCSVLCCVACRAVLCVSCLRSADHDPNPRISCLVCRVPCFCASRFFSLSLPLISVPLSVPLCVSLSPRLFLSVLDFSIGCSPDAGEQECSPKTSLCSGPSCFLASCVCLFWVVWGVSTGWRNHSNHPTVEILGPVDALVVAILVKATRARTCTVPPSSASLVSSRRPQLSKMEPHSMPWSAASLELPRERDSGSLTRLSQATKKVPGTHWISLFPQRNNSLRGLAPLHHDKLKGLKETDK